MAKLKLTIEGVTDTLDEKGVKVPTTNVVMTTGTEHKEGHCYYKVDWSCTIIVSDPNEGPTKKNRVGQWPS